MEKARRILEEGCEVASEHGEGHICVPDEEEADEIIQGLIKLAEAGEISADIEMDDETIQLVLSDLSYA